MFNILKLQSWSKPINSNTLPHSSQKQVASDNAINEPSAPNRSNIPHSSRQTDHGNEHASFRHDVIAGLRATQKSLPCKYLYDQRGSQLFDQICQLDEYYPTRTELAIMQENAEEIAAAIGSEVVLVELGSGSSLKTRILLDHLHDPLACLPVDISAAHLKDSAEELQIEFPLIPIVPLVADFSQPFQLPAQFGDEKVCVYFSGSTIGNMQRAEAVQLLRNVNSLVSQNRTSDGGGLLIGFDLQKEIDVLELAYDDPAGVTAAFNKNLLRRINRELGGNFDLKQFRHVVEYDTKMERIEIWLESLCDQVVTIGGQRFEFTFGERILTEYSHKYTVDGFARMAAEAGLQVSRAWTDDQNWFCVMYLTVGKMR